MHNHNEDSEASWNTENLQCKLQELYLDEIKKNLLASDQRFMERTLEDLLEVPDAYVKAWIAEMNISFLRNYKNVTIN